MRALPISCWVRPPISVVEELRTEARNPLWLRAKIVLWRDQERTGETDLVGCPANEGVLVHLVLAAGLPQGPAQLRELRDRHTAVLGDDHRLRGFQTFLDLGDDRDLFGTGVLHHTSFRFDSGPLARTCGHHEEANASTRSPPRLAGR